MVTGFGDFYWVSSSVFFLSQAKTKWREFPLKGLVTELMPIGDLESNGTTNIG